LGFVKRSQHSGTSQAMERFGGETWNREFELGESKSEAG